jgi:hypothetical protein
MGRRPHAPKKLTPCHREFIHGPRRHSLWNDIRVCHREERQRRSGLHCIIGACHREYSWRCFADARSDKINVISSGGASRSEAIPYQFEPITFIDDGSS